MNFVYKSKILCWCYCKISQLRYPYFKKEVERRSVLDIFNYKEIAQPLPKCYYELCTDNNCFGIGWSIRQYVGSKANYINALVEHGYFFGTYVQEMEKTTFAKKLLTFGDVRKTHISDVVKDKEVYPIGPYIHYAPDYYDENQFVQAKMKLGRTLLVFFSHSSTGESVSFDLNYLIEKINNVKEGFKTVVISLFWSDINPDIVERLYKEGYLIFSSGHRYDYYFLSRQKTMIKLADVTMSNSVGTHLAYCSFLNKPHWIVEQKIYHKAFNKTGEANIAIGEKMNTDVKTQEEQEELINAFSSYSEVLSDDQRNICDKYFGLEQIKTKDEMLRIISSE